jgi:flagellin
MIINTDRLSANALQPTLARGKSANAPASQTAPETQFTPAGEQLAVRENNLTAANSHLQDVDAAKATLEQVRQSILGQPAKAILAQANSLPQSALQLLQ